MSVSPCIALSVHLDHCWEDATYVVVTPTPRFAPLCLRHLEVLCNTSGWPRVPWYFIPLRTKDFLIWAPEEP